MVVTGLPLAKSVTPVMSAGLPVPETESVSPVTVTEEVEGLVKTACWTGTFGAPEAWLELAGGLGPWAAATVTGVGVPVGVRVGVRVGVLLAVKDGVAVIELVGVP